MIKFNTKNESFYYKDLKDTAGYGTKDSKTFSEHEVNYTNEKKQRENGVVGNTLFQRTALISLFKNRSFSGKFSEYEKSVVKSDIKSSRSKFKEIGSAVDNESRIAKKSFNKNQKILFVNPVYLRLDIRKEIAVRYDASEKNKKVFNSYLMNFSKKVKIKSEILDKDVIRNNTDIESYNDMSVAQGWIEEMYRCKGVSMMPAYYDGMMDITKKYDTDQIAVIGTVSLVERTDRKGLKIITGLLVPAYLPIAILKVASPTYHTVVFGNIFSVSKGISVKREENYLKYKDRTDILASGLYDILLKIKNHKNEETK